MENVSVQLVQKKRKNKEDIAILDVRTPGEHEEIYIPDTLHIPLDELSQRFEELPLNKELYIYCASGNRSQSACTFLEQKSGVRVFNVEGGIMAWHAVGFPVKYAKGDEGLF